MQEKINLAWCLIKAPYSYWAFFLSFITTEQLKKPIIALRRVPFNGQRPTFMQNRLMIFQSREERENKKAPEIVQSLIVDREKPNPLVNRRRKVLLLQKNLCFYPSQSASFSRVEGNPMAARSMFGYLLTSKKNFCLKELFGLTVCSRYKSIESI